MANEMVNVTLGIFPVYQGIKLNARLTVARLETATWPATTEGRSAAVAWLAERGLDEYGEALDARAA